MVRERKFSEALYYRLNVVSIRVPPLRERVEDIPLLVHRMVSRASGRNGIAARWLTSEALERLRTHPWPGNVRELENVLEQALIVASGPVIGPEDLALSAHTRVAAEDVPTVPGTLRDVEIDHIRRVLAATGGNESMAARVLGIHRGTLSRKIRRYGLA
jgi:DNA-binding NtrC family response regulator